MKIKADTRKCSKEKCNKKGVQWIVADPDIKPFVLCRKHLTELEMKMLKMLNRRCHKCIGRNCDWKCHCKCHGRS